MTEALLQQTIVTTIQQLYPAFVINLSLSGIQLHGSPQQIAKTFIDLKKQGFQRGLPDLSIAIPNGITLHLELKKPSGGRQSKDQIRIQKQLESLGHNYTIIRSVDELLDTIAKYTTKEYRREASIKSGIFPEAYRLNNKDK